MEHSAKCPLASLTILAISYISAKLVVVAFSIFLPLSALLTSAYNNVCFTHYASNRTIITASAADIASATLVETFAPNYAKCSVFAGVLLCTSTC